MAVFIYRQSFNIAVFLTIQISKRFGITCNNLKFNRVDTD